MRLIGSSALLPTLFLCACTGTNAAAPGTAAKATISGVVSAGPVQAGTVTAYEVTAAGAQGAQLGVTTSDSKGNYQLSLVVPTNAVLIVVSGGTYVEEGSGATITMGNAQMRTTLASLSDGQKVGVTPLTEIATQHALASILANNTADVSAIIKASNDKVAAGMGLTDITIPPANPTVPATAADGAPAAQYALVLASLSQMAKTATTVNGTPISSLDMMQALATTFTYNGSFTSSIGSTNVPVPNAAGVSITLNSVLGGATNFNLAMQSAQTAVRGSMPSGFNDDTICPPSTFITAPAEPHDAPTLVVPSPPTTLPSAEPTLEGPPKPKEPTTHAPTPTPRPLTPVAATWHARTQVGTDSADYATLAYAPSGQAYVGYSIVNGNNVTSNAKYDLYTAAQTGDAIFATPVRVALGTEEQNRGGGIFGSYHFVSASEIWLAAESDYFLNIYKSTDSGSTWTQQKFYSVSDRDQSFNHSLWVDLGSGNLALYFGYEYFNPVLNSGPLLSFANFTSGMWDTALTQLNLTDDPTSIIKSGSNILFPDHGGLATSTDNGLNFAHNWTVGARELHKIGSTIFANDYTGLSQSTDSGATWSQVYTGRLDGRLAGNGNLMVVVSGESSYVLSYTASADGGLTWTAPVVLADLTSAGHNISSVQLAVSANGRIGLVYSEQSYNGNFGPGSYGRGVHFVEFY